MRSDLRWKVGAPSATRTRDKENRRENRRDCGSPHGPRSCDPWPWPTRPALKSHNGTGHAESVAPGRPEGPQPGVGGTGAAALAPSP